MKALFIAIIRLLVLVIHLCAKTIGIVSDAVAEMTGKIGEKLAK